jgi:ribosomal protein S18 acetylase RimI-like enzyme
MTNGIKIRELNRGDLVQAGQILGRGMCNNPANIRAFAISDAEQRSRALTRFFVPVLLGLYRRGIVYGAFRNEGMVGVCGIARPGFCQPTLLEKLRVFPAVVSCNSVLTGYRVSKWASAWARKDPQTLHWHIGPIAVDPAIQCQGIGSAMLAAVCLHMDAYGSVSYLETDCLKNVSFYQKFGFVVLEQSEVLGVSTWYMSRSGHNSGSAHLQ